MCRKLQHQKDRTADRWILAGHKYQKTIGLTVRRIRNHRMSENTSEETGALVNIDWKRIAETWM